MKQAWVNMAVVMVNSAPVWGIVPVSAADSAIPNVVQQEQLEMARQRAEARNERNQTKRVEIEGIRTSTDADNAVDETGPSFFITHIELGDENQTDVLEGEFRFLEPLLRNGEQQAMNVGAIEAFVKSLNEALINRGFITSQVRIPEQNIESGTLRLTLLPGRLGRVLYSEGSLTPSWESAFPIREGYILQQSGAREVFAYSTTYSFHIPSSELYNEDANEDGDKEYLQDYFWRMTQMLI